jgi:hypothetical protein
MKTSQWILGGVAIFLILPVAGMMTGFAFDDPTVPTYFAIVRVLLAITLSAIPAVWLIALILSIVEAKNKKRENILKRYASAPNYAWGAHLLVWLLVILGMKWS